MGKTNSPAENDEKPLILAGLGMWGSTWIELVESSPYWDAQAYVDIDEERVEQAVADHGITKSKGYTDLKRAMAETDAEAVLCVVPPSAHRDIAIQAFDEGLDILTEKPLADDIAAAQEMVTAGENAGCKLMVSQNYRFKQGPRTVRHITDNDLLGAPEYASVEFHKAPVFSGYRPQMDHPLLVDMSIHHFDLMRYVLDLDPVSVYAQEINTSWSYFDHEPIASVTVEMENDVLINYFGSWVSQGQSTTWDGDWRIECAGGEIDWRDNRVRIVSDDAVTSVFQEDMVEVATDGTPDKGILDVELTEMPSEARQYSLFEFYDAVDNDREPETSGRDNIKSFALMESAVQSSEEGRKIEIDI
jgi:predicted dehydrogenase